MVRGGVRSYGQVSLEYLMVMAFAIFLTAPLILLYYTESNRLNDATVGASIRRAAAQIGEAADTVYYLGAGSSRTLTVHFPANIRNVTISGQSLSFTVEGTGGDYQQNAWSAANLTGNFSITEGPHVIVVTALADSRVNISER